MQYPMVEYCTPVCTVCTCVCSGIMNVIEKWYTVHSAVNWNLLLHLWNFLDNIRWRCARLCEGAEEQIQNEALFCQAPTHGLFTCSNCTWGRQHGNVSKNDSSSRHSVMAYCTVSPTILRCSWLYKKPPPEHAHACCGASKSVSSVCVCVCVIQNTDEISVIWIKIQYVPHP